MKTQVHFKSIWVLCIFCILFSASSFGLIDGKKLTIGDAGIQGGAPYFFAKLDAAGYSDWIYYGRSPHHDYDYHELLSGEWGSAAIYYEGIDTAVIDPNTGKRQAMWLTQCFEFPDWGTNSNFSAPGLCAASNNPNNPVPRMNTGRSLIANGDVEITIDYEVVDLEPLGSTYSPMSFISDLSDRSIGYMYSDRYIFLQTYTIRNKKAQALTNLEFYQFLHSHGADEGGPYVNSTYCDANLQDPLADYVPYNPVHCAPGSNTAGNFRYDITQWNSPQSAQSHSDYVCFSSTIEPDWIDNDTYNGHSGRPSAGTHTHIENRRLNGINRIFNAEVGGAMGWSLGSLDPNQTTSLTVAFMFGPQQETADLALIKTDNRDPQTCASPGDWITYTIYWENLGVNDAEDAVLIDYLPAGVDYPFVLGVNPLVWDPNYQAAEHSYTWPLGTIEAGSSGSRQLTVQIQEKAEPGMPMRNRAVLTTSIGQISAEWYTPICCREEDDIIYVDRQAAGANIGTSWRDAYTDLQKALARAEVGCGKEIWVAQGTYDPGRKASETFVIPEETSVYGGFAGYETSRDQRNPKKNKTILTGDADAERNDTVVQMGNNSVLDGFTITDAAEYCVYGLGVDFTLDQSIVENSDGYGIRASNGNVTIRWCEIKNCVDDGVRHEGSGFSLNIDNSWVMKNLARGVACTNSIPYIRNSILTESDLSEAGNAGIHIFNPTSMPVLYNCTFAHNRSEGVFFADNGTVDDPNDKDYPDIQNCILWLNNKGGSQLSGLRKQHIYHCCMYDPNDPQGSTIPDVNYNITADPKFAYLDPNNVHILFDSPCKDAGSPILNYDEQVDMDRKERVYGAAVDIGAYEIACEEIANPLDWNADGLVNYVEFAAFSRAWLSCEPNFPGDPNNWNPACNLEQSGDSEHKIDLSDLAVFAEEAPWLWRACWLDGEDLFKQIAGGGEGMSRRGNAILANQPEPSSKQKIADLVSIIVFLEKIWLEEPDIQQEIDVQIWQEFMDSVYQGLLDLQSDDVQIE